MRAKLLELFYLLSFPLPLNCCALHLLMTLLLHTFIIVFAASIFSSFLQLFLIFIATSSFLYGLFLPSFFSSFFFGLNPPFFSFLAIRSPLLSSAFHCSPQIDSCR